MWRTKWCTLHGLHGRWNAQLKVMKPHSNGQSLEFIKAVRRSLSCIIVIFPNFPKPKRCTARLCKCLICHAIMTDHHGTRLVAWHSLDLLLIDFCKKKCVWMEPNLTRNQGSIANYHALVKLSNMNFCNNQLFHKIEEDKVDFNSYADSLIAEMKSMNKWPHMKLLISRRLIYILEFQWKQLVTTCTDTNHIELCVTMGSITWAPYHISAHIAQEGVASVVCRLTL